MENITENDRSYRFGWFPDYPDIRDYTEKHKMENRTAEVLT